MTDDEKNDAMRKLVEAIAKNGGGDIEQVDPLQVVCPTRSCCTVIGTPCGFVDGKFVFHKARWNKAFKERKFRKVFTIKADDDDSGRSERVLSMLTPEETAALERLKVMARTRIGPGEPGWEDFRTEFYQHAHVLGVPPGERDLTFTEDLSAPPTVIIEWSRRKP